MAATWVSAAATRSIVWRGVHYRVAGAGIRITRDEWDEARAAADAAAAAPLAAPKPAVAAQARRTVHATPVQE